MAELVNDKTQDVITLKNIDLKYSGEKGEILALQNINLNIKKGEFICVLGPSGCGKSTLLKIIAGFLKPSNGEARMDDIIIQGPNWDRGVVFQTPVLYPWLNIYDNVAFPLKMRKIKKDEIKEIANKYLELVNLKKFEKNKPYELSGGMRQRASLARVLVNSPRMILMDEPLGALDALTREHMQKLIRNIWSKTDNTVLLITHDVDEALTLATRVIVMSNRPGKIVKSFSLGFTNDILNENNEEIRYSPQYIKYREEILSIINSYDEEVNTL